MTKHCKKCGDIKPLECFNKTIKSRDGYASSCKVCIQERNTELVRKYRKIFSDRLREFPCAACGFDHVNAKEVHHLNSKYKRYGRSQDIRYNLEDIDKGYAIVLCPTCHVLFHAAHGGKNQPFPEYSKEETILIILKERGTQNNNPT